jgi:hypothetical protein
MPRVTASRPTVTGTRPTVTGTRPTVTGTRPTTTTPYSTPRTPLATTGTPEPPATQRLPSTARPGRSKNTSRRSSTATAAGPDSSTTRLLDDDLGVLTEVEATDAFDAVEGAADPPMAVVLDGTVDQRLVDVAAQRGVGTLFGRDAGDLVKRPVGTRIVTVADRAVEA